MPAHLIDSAPPRASELPAAPPRPASEDAGQPSRAIIPGDDPGDQQPPESTPVPVIHVDIDHSKANDLGISIRSIGEPWLCWSANTMSTGSTASDALTK